MAMSVGAGVGTDLHEIPARVQQLEALGYDFVGVGETSHNPFLPLVLVAEHTQHMRFGTSVAIAFPRVPHITANIAWDLAKYSGLKTACVRADPRSATRDEAQLRGRVLPAQAHQPHQPGTDRAPTHPDRDPAATCSTRVWPPRFATAPAARLGTAHTREVLIPASTISARRAGKNPADIQIPLRASW
jgi:hypothetical protein